MNQLAEAICAIGRRAYQRGLVAGTEGNFSCRIDAQRVLCTPSNFCKGLLATADLCVVDPDGRQLAGARPCSSEIRLHLEIYRAAPAVGAVIHTHPPFATTFAVLGETIPGGILPEAEFFLGPVPLIPFHTPGTEELGLALRPYAQSHVAAILQNHGAVTWGADLDEAYNRTEILEAVCRVLFQARQFGTPRPIPPDRLPALRRPRPDGPPRVGDQPGRAGT